MSIEILTEYGNELVAAGFEVWLTKTYSRAGGYLQYRDPATGAQGSLQYSVNESAWQHLMPIVPSRQYGSSMSLQTATDPFTVDAARECARLSNYNDVVGIQYNAKDRAWRSSRAIALHS
jgi:hypothetical protein